MFTFTALLGAQSSSPAEQSLLEFDGGVKVLVDVGWDDSFDASKLQELEKHVSTLSIVLLTHATIEHLGAYAHCCKHLPGFSRIPCYATTPVVNLGRTLMLDLYGSSPQAASTIPRDGIYSSPISSSPDEGANLLLQPPTAEEIGSYFSLINPLKYSQPHQPIPSPFSPPLAGLTVTAYSAGHSLGGTIWHIQHGLESIVYASDWNLGRENFFPGAAWLSSGDGGEVLEALHRPTALICSSRGVQRADALPRRDRDSRITGLIRDTIAQGVQRAKRRLRRMTALDTMTKVMKLKLSRIFVTTSERDTFIGMLTRPTYMILESEMRVKSTAIRMHAFKVLCVAIKHHGHAYGAQTSIIQNLTYFEHLAEPMAEFLNILAVEYDYSQLAEEVMKELSNKEFSAADTKGPKSVSTFVARLSELAPRVVQRQVTYLAKLLESENYTLRCAIIEVCGNLIAMLSRASEDDEDARSENHKGQINAFFDVLEERFLDVNPYCRCRAMQVYVKLFGELETKHPKRRQKAAELAARSLEDKSSNVRRNAIKLLARLISTHPFAALHGGLLSYTEWNERLEACETELNALKPPAGTPGLGERTQQEQTVDESLLDDATTVEDKAPMTEEQKMAAFQKAQEDAATAEAVHKLNLTRRYYIEALRFIETLHEASPSVTQLLGSKNKSEVIEAMDFFVVADAYRIETAKSGIRRMLRLIWTKGNSDEGKGVQTHLIECYRGLFFEAPANFSPNDKANYVARNMISLTFGASPAELTSLEQLLATMMKEKAISELVVQKLWQVYGVQKKEISRQQRRGAIIILGMLALADPDIVVREMETCLRIGLGSIGRKDLILARYTCIALMRMTNLKPTKGVEGKASTRLPNDHAVLVRLAALMEVKSESKDWYGLAEQVVGAIYALAKHPDVLCSEIIRRKTREVFAATSKAAPKQEDVGETSQVDADGDIEMSDEVSPPPEEEEQQNEASAEDGGSSVTGLSQLLFAVGHIALKQIVHLELCEQDFKRRKAEKEKANPNSSPVKKTPAAKSAKKDDGKKEEPTAEEEMDLIGGTNEDDFTDAIAHIRERELLYGKNSLLSNFGPLAKEICSNNTSYPNAELQSQAALCMAKLMCVSGEYCEANLGLLITILERSPSAITRSNLVVALGDMAVCFNHLIDENTDFLYRRLSDRSLQVKRTCLMTLTFLILAGQVKVKGQLGEMAKCVEDEDTKVREMSRMFFAELAGKDNAVYNHFVDMFSLLSADAELDEDRFRRIVKFLASFIEKDKHAKQLAAKLAPRLQRAENERQWNDVAFALGLLPHKNEDIAKMVGEGCKVVEAAA